MRVAPPGHLREGVTWKQKKGLLFEKFHLFLLGIILLKMSLEQKFGLDMVIQEGGGKVMDMDNNWR